MGQNEKIGSRTPTDAMRILPGRTGPAATLSGEAHIYRRSTAVLAPTSLSSLGTQPQARLPGTWRGHVLRIPLSGRYPPLPVPVQRKHLALPALVSPVRTSPNTGGAPVRR